MKTKTKWIIGGCFASVLVVGTFVLWHFLPGRLLTPRAYSSWQMWSITHEWTRTAPLPVDASEISIRTEGSDFTRQFLAAARFKDASSLALWMSNSPGFKDAEVTVEADGSKIYVIKPGGGALFAEVTVHPDLRIEINTYWS
jgi:hypothetical protein